MTYQTVATTASLLPGRGINLEWREIRDSYEKDPTTTDDNLSGTAWLQGSQTTSTTSTDTPTVPDWTALRDPRLSAALLQPGTA